MAETFRPPFLQPTSVNGVPLAGGLLYFYQATTTTPITVYQDASLSTPHASPVVADASGIFPEIFVNSRTYKIVLQTSAAVTVYTADNIQAAGNLFPDGTVSLPGMAFASDTDTGFYRIGANNFAATVGGVGQTQWSASLFAPIINDGVVLGSGSLSFSDLYLASGGVINWANSDVTLTHATGKLTIANADAGASAMPTLDLYRNSASPAANDVIAEVDFTGQNSTPAKVTYGRIRTIIDDKTASSEDAHIALGAQIAGTVTDYLHLGANAAGTATANALGLPLGQLSFPATQNASSDANTLDDYEEGTWTPGITFGGSATGVTTSTNDGRYVKIGKWVWFIFRLTLTNNGSGSGNAAITGLPFTADSFAEAGSAQFLSWAGMSGVVGNPFGQVVGSGTTINLRMSGAAASAAMTDTIITNTGDISCSGFYYSAA